MQRCYCLMVRTMFGICLFFSSHAVIFHEYSCAQQPILQQLVYLNIPAYNLNLYTQYEDQRWERLSVPIELAREWNVGHKLQPGKANSMSRPWALRLSMANKTPQNWWEKRLPTQIPLIRIR